MKLAMLAALVATPVVAAAAGAPPQVELVTSNQLQAFVSTTKDGLAVHPVFNSPTSSALVVRRDASGEVERHAAMNDIMVAKTGTISVLLGGSVEGGRETAPGEWRGGRIVGGALRKLTPGDMMWIPAGIPHQMILPRGRSFTYIAIKVPNR